MDRRRPFHKARRSDFVKLLLLVAFAMFIVVYLHAMFKQLDTLNSPEARSRHSRAPLAGGSDRNAGQQERRELALDEVEGDLGALFHPAKQRSIADDKLPGGKAGDTAISNEPPDMGFIEPLKVETIVASGTTATKPPLRRRFHSLMEGTDKLASKLAIHAAPLDLASGPLRYDPQAEQQQQQGTSRLLAMYDGIAADHGDDAFFDSPQGSGLLIGEALRRSVAAAGEHTAAATATPPLRSAALADLSTAWTRDVPELRVLLQRVQMLNKEMRSGARPARYVFVHPVGQLCNRLMAIASGFLLALLTQRGLLVDDAGFYAQTPELFLEPGFPWLATEEQMATVLNDPTTLRIENPESGVWVETEPLLCGDLVQHYAAHRHIDLSINQYFNPFLTSNLHVRSDLLRLFRGSDNIFFFLSHFLFRPLPLLQQRLKTFVEEAFVGKFVVGLQVRSGQDFTSNFMTSADWQLYFGCAGALVAASVPREQVLFFIATDTDQGRQSATAELAALGWPASQLRFGPGAFQNSNNAEGVQKALLDLMILSVCDDRVTTAWSSYGYFAAGFSGSPAAMVVDDPPSAKDADLIAVGHAEQRFMGVPHKSDKRRQCVRLPTSQPCFHKFASWGAATTTCYSAEMRDREMLHGRYC